MQWITNKTLQNVSVALVSMRKRIGRKVTIILHTPCPSSLTDGKGEQTIVVILSTVE